MSFKFERLSIQEVILIHPEIHEDERGFFLETYKFSDFTVYNISDHFVQDNHSKSVRGVLRGLHYQKNPKAQGKLVRVTRGEVLDVAVDIRKGSPSYAQWVSANLSAQNKMMLYIPPGFAHGVCVVSETAEVLYKVTEEYSHKDEAGIAWNDPQIGIQWPIQNPILSVKDSKNPFLKDIDTGFIYTSKFGTKR